MKFLIIACLAALAAADVSHIVGNRKDESKAEIVSQELDVSPDGGYQWAFKSDNGISQTAQGDIKPPAVRSGTDGEQGAAQTVQGEAAWTSPEGEAIQFSYVADENGYQPQGSHLPTPPPIPEAILRALEYIRTHPPAPEN